MKSNFSIIILILLSFQVFPQSDLRVISSDQNSLIIEYTPIYQETRTININGTDFLRYTLSNEYIQEPIIPGSPLIPSRKFNAGVPSEFGNTIEVLNTVYKEVSGKLAPFPEMLRDKELTKLEYFIGANYYDELHREIVAFEDFGISRGLPLQGIIINPVQFNPSLNTIRLYSKILFKINFSRSAAPGKDYVEDDFMKEGVINYEAAKVWNKRIPKKLNKIQVENSVLAEGTWYKFECKTEGIYKITRSMLQSYGIDPNNVDPRTIKIYNNGGKVLPELVSAQVPTDLVENSIIVIGEEDGKFDESDYILFYGRGVHFWDYDSLGARIARYFHPYSAKNYYWITAGGSQGKRMEAKESLLGNAEYVQTTTKAFKELEEDKINLPKSGRQFFGDDFSNTTKSRTYMNKLDGLVSGSPINYKFKFVNSHTSPVSLTIEENSNQLLSISVSGTGTGSFNLGVDTERTAIFNGSLQDNRSLLKFTYNTNSPAAVGYLDYYEIYYQKTLTPVDDRMIFFSHDTTAVVEYQLSSFSNSDIKVFDVTDYGNAKLITNPYISGGEFRFKSQESFRSVSKYYAVGSGKYLEPSNPVKAENSNYHGISDGAQVIVVTSKTFLDFAGQYKQYRENESDIKYSVKVFEIDKIFNEFSGGLTDVSGLRNFIKYAYNNWAVAPDYLVLFGDGTFDYKNIEGANLNHVITYQSVNSLHVVSSFTSDDYFVAVDGNDWKPELSTGRIPCRTTTEAQTYINKIKSYEKNSDTGNWRNHLALVADDGWTSEGNDGNIHTKQMEEISDIIPASYDRKKIYLAAYPTVITSAGRRKPQVNEEIVSAMNNGSLLVNFIGHGNPDVWTHEMVFNKNTTIPQLTNGNRLFFLTAATCDFADFDKIGYQSGAEELIFKNNGGSIVSYASARLVYANANHNLMQQYFGRLFNSVRDTLNLPMPIGRVNFLAKTDRTGENDLKYHTIGDPLIRILIPQYFSNIDSVNGLVPDTAIQVSALSNASVSGRVLNPDSTKWDTFNGEGILTIFDSERKVFLEDINYSVNMPGGIIFRGRVSINNGVFKSNFVVPKDISYENKRGKIVFYFLGNNADGIGYTNNIIVGGTDSSIVNDGNGPLVEIYFDDSKHKNSSLATTNSTLIIELEDETGLNTTGTGIGHKLSGVLNDNTSDPLDFTNYFTGDLDAGGKSGEVRYKFSNIEQGEYKLDVTAWDVFNNFTKETAYFTVVSDEETVIRDVFNYPNPFSSNTTFTFQQNLNKPFDIIIKIYTVAGRMIKEIERKGVDNMGFVTVDWDGKDQDGSQIANGTYFYKLILKTIDGTESKSVLGKMAVIK